MFAQVLSRKFDLSDYIAWSTVVSVFLQQHLFRAGVDVYLGYFVVVANGLLLFASGQLVVHRAHLAILLLIAGVSFWAAYLADTPLTAPIAQIVGISAFSIYYFSAVATQRHNLFRLMDIYSACSVLVVAYGILQYVLLKIVTAGAFPLRLTSIFVEPALLVNATLPAFCYLFFRFVEDRSHKWELAIMAAGYAMADSSLGFLGVLLMLGIAFMRKATFWRSVSAILILALVGGAVYLGSANVRMRIVGTFLAVSSQNVEDSNQTSYAILTNTYVSYQSFLDHPFIGVGLGGHQFSYEKYVGDIVQQGTEFYGQNDTDANSMVLRLISELGLFGILGMCFFFVYFHRALGEKYRFLQKCFIPYFVVRLARDGHYFSLELYFFLAIYTMNFLESRVVAYTRPQSMGLGQRA